MKKALIIITLAGFLPVTQAAEPVIAATNQLELLKSNNTKLAANKKLAFDFFRIVLRGRHLEQASKFMREDYIQHNPNVETGLKGFVDYFSKLGGPRTIPDQVPGLVSIQAEGEYVTLSFVNEQTYHGDKYTTTWFDMFRIQDSKIAEHWDCEIKR